MYVTSSSLISGSHVLAHSSANNQILPSVQQLSCFLSLLMLFFSKISTWNPTGTHAPLRFSFAVRAAVATAAADRCRCRSLLAVVDRHRLDGTVTSTSTSAAPSCCTRSFAADLGSSVHWLLSLLRTAARILPDSRASLFLMIICVATATSSFERCSAASAVSIDTPAKTAIRPALALRSAARLE